MSSAASFTVMFAEISGTGDDMMSESTRPWPEEEKLPPPEDDDVNTEPEELGIIRSRLFLLFLV
jgi:hypothetical protein